MSDTTDEMIDATPKVGWSILRFASECARRENRIRLHLNGESLVADYIKWPTGDTPMPGVLECLISVGTAEAPSFRSVFINPHMICAFEEYTIRMAVNDFIASARPQNQ